MSAPKSKAAQRKKCSKRVSLAAQVTCRLTPSELAGLDELRWSMRQPTRSAVIRELVLRAVNGDRS